MSNNLNPKFSAQQLYNDVLKKSFALTEEQVAAVEQASVSAPSLVVAGAGSGKTELMAVRVIWLVANGYALPEQILGLTFTRKAANELARRINNALADLVNNKTYCPEGLTAEFAPPTVSTYNSYANSIFRDFALGLGYEAESTLLTEAAAFQVARELLIQRGDQLDSRLSEIDDSVDRLVGKVLEMAQSLNDNVVNAWQVDSVIGDILANYGALQHRNKTFTRSGEYAKVLDSLSKTRIIASLAEHYRTEKRRQGYVDYSDQVVLAERAVREIPDAVERERRRFTQVLLDEYQDTSYLQTRLLAQLFANQSVFAVGDPNQSIYGWRGASASNLESFGRDFAVGFEAETLEANVERELRSLGRSTKAQLFTLSTSWRNPVSVLQLSNHLAEPLKTAATYLPVREQSLRPVELQPRTGADIGSIQVRFDQTIIDEASNLAEWMRARMDAALASNETKSAAVLMRKKTNMALFVEQLELRGLDVEVVGLGGLLELPEVVDLVSALRVVHDPNAGTQLVRLLTGARWRIAPKDIDRLFRFANKLNKAYSKSELYAEEDALSLVDALDHLLDDYHAQRAGFSELSLARLQNAAQVFANLRAQTGLPLVDFVRAVEQELWLDIEVRANPKRKHPMAHLNAFANVVAGYSKSTHRPTLGSFLRWLEFAESRERFEIPSTKPEAGRVQVMTVHAAKGLEWDYVAIPNLIAEDFPSKPKSATGWLSSGVLPYQLRGDAASLPQWNIASIDPANQTIFNNSVKTFKAQVSEHLLREEQRLIYVAVTRPKAQLLLSGSYWKGKIQSPRDPSEFLLKALELEQLVEVLTPGAAAGLAPVESATNPLLQLADFEAWPLEPLGTKHADRVNRAAAQVTEAVAKVNSSHAAEPASVELDSKVFADIRLLLGEREARINSINTVELPIRINASGFKDYLVEPEEAAARLQRPIPLQPFAATRAGTIFHNMMEERFAALSRATFSDPTADDYQSIAEQGQQIAAMQLSAIDLAAHRDKVSALQETFSKSRWANQIPADTEIEIQLAIGNNIFICKLDAVFATADGGYEVVDWKTGKKPATKDEAAQRALQLALYRMAYAQYKKLNPDNVTATLYYVEDDFELKPDLLSREQLLELWGQVATVSAL